MTEQRPEGYLWDNTLSAEKARLNAQAAIWDPYTRRYLEEIGVAPGWRCLEVGAGTGTITAWLADRVSPHGSVVATDIDTRFLEAAAIPSVEVRQHNITTDNLEEDEYDLVYARMVLMHLPDADTHLAKMAGAVRPGGWLLVQDADLSFGESPASKPFTWPPSNQRFSVKIMRALNGLLSMTGASPSYAQGHPTRLIALGFSDGGAESVNRLARGEKGGTYEAAFERVAPYLVQYGGMSERDVQRRLKQLGDPDITFSSAPMISAWGRRPA